MIPVAASRGPLRLLWITNIPTPYRNYRYRLMREILPQKGLEFEVLYMARTEHGRHWGFTPAELDHPHRFFRGLHPRVRGVTLHINPGLLWYLLHQRADLVLVGGFSAPTLLLAPHLVRTGLRLLGSESNSFSATRNRGPAAALKRYSIGRFDGFIVPGRPAVDYLVRLDPDAADKPHIFLPNLVDNDVFVESVTARRASREEERARLGVPKGHQLWFCPARLEARKGVAEFLDVLRKDDPLLLLVAGDGSQRAALQSKIDEGSLPARLLGQQTQDQVRDLYAAADVFLLPSLQDPSPLSAVEAAAASLPLVLSVRAGNFDDVLQEDVNGWAYDPAAPRDFRPVLSRILDLDDRELSRIGRLSRERFLARFNGPARIAQLADDLLDLARDRP